MEQLQKAKRKHHLQSTSSSDEPECTKGKSKHHCDQPAPSRVPLSSDHHLGAQCHHPSAWEKRRKLKSKRSKRRERRRQTQARQDESKAHAEERSEFRRHVRKAQEISSKSGPGQTGIGCSATTLITQNRLTRGIYNKGKRSNTVVRDLSDASKSVQLKVKEGLRRIIGYKSPGRAVSITASPHDALLERTDLLSGSHGSPPDGNSANLQELLESTHLHATPPSRDAHVLGEVTAPGRSSDWSVGSAFSRESGVKELPGSPPLEQLSAELAERLNLERYFPDTDYLTKVQNDLKKLIDLSSPPIQKRAHCMSGNRKPLSSACRRLEDAFASTSSPGESSRQIVVEAQNLTPRRNIICRQETPSSNDHVSQTQQTGNRWSQGAEHQSSLKKFKESINSQARLKNRATLGSKVDATVQTNTRHSQWSGHSTKSCERPSQRELVYPALDQSRYDRRGETSKLFPEIGARHRPASADACILDLGEISSQSVCGVFDACPSPWIECCPMRRHWSPAVRCGKGQEDTAAHTLDNPTQSQRGLPSKTTRSETIPGLSSRGRMLHHQGFSCGSTHGNQSSRRVRESTTSLSLQDQPVGGMVRPGSSVARLQEELHRHRVFVHSKRVMMESSMASKDDTEQMTHDDLSDDNMLDCLQLLRRTEEGMARSSLPRSEAHLRAVDYCASNDTGSRRSEHEQKYGDSRQGHSGEISQEYFEYQKENILRTSDGRLVEETCLSSLGDGTQQSGRHRGLPMAPQRQPLSPLASNGPSPIKKKKKPFTWMTLADSSDTDDAMDSWSSDLPLPPPPVLLLPDTPKMYPQKMF